MSLAFIHRNPTLAEVEQFRLLLSTFQDGSGMLAQKDGQTLPGGRDFERTVAAAFHGINQENKFIFDVLISVPGSSVQYGISCKMRAELDRVRRDGRVTIELTNSSKKLKDYLGKQEVFPADYASRPNDVGVGIVNAVESWKHEVGIGNGGAINLDKSGYLVLQYNKRGVYQLFWFQMQLPDPKQIHWYYPDKQTKGGAIKVAGHLNGDHQDGGRVFEWYSDSGGQLKYYPLATDALWTSEEFRLEPLSEEAKVYGLMTKAESYFPKQWNQVVSPTEE
ncbi:MAG: hypothetical protein ACYDBJ_09000 [Aggregatilineales bacterium]